MPAKRARCGQLGANSRHKPTGTMLHRVVRVSGLTSRPDLNGVVGIATHFQQERNRYSVTFPTSESLSVAAERLERADVPDEPTPALMLVHREAFHMRLRWRRAEHVAGRYNTPLDDLQAALLHVRVFVPWRPVS